MWSHLMQDFFEFVKALPHDPGGLLSVIVTNRPDFDNFSSFAVSANRIRTALVRLETNNIWYSDGYARR